MFEWKATVGVRLCDVSKGAKQRSSIWTWTWTLTLTLTYVCDWMKVGLTADQHAMNEEEEEEEDENEDADQFPWE